MKSNTINNLILDLRFNSDTSFKIVLIKESKTKSLIFRKVSKRILSMPLNEYFDYLSYIEID